MNYRVNYYPLHLLCLIPRYLGNDSNLLIVFYVQIMPDDFVMQLHRF
ncbi:pilus assembly protein [Escherichia coli]|nr:pilus assembly protein [Escherichia coli]OKV23436.1 pilus assembly protein [Escherichia coli]